MSDEKKQIVWKTVFVSGNFVFFFLFLGQIQLENYRSGH